MQLNWIPPTIKRYVRVSVKLLLLNFFLAFTSCCRKSEDKQEEDDFHRYGEEDNGNYASKPFNTGRRQNAARDSLDADAPVTARHVNPTMASTFDPYDPDCQVHKTQAGYGAGGLGDEPLGEDDSGRGSAISLDEFGGPSSSKDRLNGGGVGDAGKSNLSYV